MKGRWFFLAACCIGCIYFRENLLCMSLIFSFYCIKNRDKSCFFCLFLLIAFYVSSQSVVIKPNSHAGKVIEIKKNSVILDIEGTKIIGYNFDSVILDELVSFEGDFSLIESSLSTYGFNYEKWANRNEIYYSVYAQNVQCLKESTSLRGKLQKKLMEADNRIGEFLLKTIFSSSDVSFGTLDELLVLSGTHIATLFQLLESMLSLFCSKSGMIALAAMFITGSVFHFKFIYQRLIIQKLLHYTNLDSKDRLGLLILLLMMINVNCIYSSAFLFPVLLKTIRCFSGENSYVKRTVSLAFVQCLLNYRVNLSQIFLFPLFRKLIAIEIIFSILSLFIPSLAGIILFSLKILSKFSGLSNPLLEFRGSLQFPLVCIVFLFLCSIKKSNRLKAYFILTAVLVFNMNHWAASVNFINVDQGDSIFIQLPFNRGNYLIDTGSASSYTKPKSFLYAKGVRKIDALFITHEDEDHAGNIESLKEDFAVKQVIDTKRENYSDSNFSMIFLLPEDIGKNINENSLIMMCEINHLKFLFLGDITAEIEQILVQTYTNLQADIVKLAHHGSSTSTSEKLLDQIQARYAVISCGLNNRYHHPSHEVTERLKRYPIQVYTTAKEGDISFILTRFINFICTSGKFLI